MSSSIITVKITQIEPHPDAKKLKVCQVDTGSELVQVVCGSSNISEGMITILAQPGATLPNGKVINHAELRGVKSAGMLCSALDLSIREERGIIDIASDTQIGLQLDKLNIEELSSTPWYQYTHVDSHWMNSSVSQITVTLKDRLNIAPSSEHFLVSQTFFDGKQYQYRHFSERIKK